MSYASRRASEQMERDGIRKLSAWGSPRRIGCATYRAHIGLPDCGEVGCGKRARYSTKAGNRCFAHALAARGDA